MSVPIIPIGYSKGRPVIPYSCNGYTGKALLDTGATIPVFIRDEVILKNLGG